MFQQLFPVRRANDMARKSRWFYPVMRTAGLLVAPLLIAACVDGQVVEVTGEPTNAVEIVETTRPADEEPAAQGGVTILSQPLQGSDLETFLARVEDAQLIEDLGLLVDGSAAGLPSNSFALQGAVITQTVPVATDYGDGLMIGVLLIDEELPEVNYPIGNYQVVAVENAQLEAGYPIRDDQAVTIEDVQSDGLMIILVNPQAGTEILGLQPEYHENGVPGLEPGEVKFIVTESSPRRCGWWIFCVNC
ncbi:MAG: hypothetical protein L0332_17345 [Chloroflexi bacterium]|nr:hypothetical protein [Chloroflexota bacterium]MCI0579213.1 hypothetical protein [Chloroflexota bacterium]MCI0648274.1 hypothetical protein [Chloroflexota bacterium]MCI0728466.1 hypothetical protein [Chloroflexota bacterium]